MLLDHTSRALLAALRLDPSFFTASEAMLDEDEYAQDALRCECALHPDLFTILRQLFDGESVPRSRLRMSDQHQAAFGAVIGDKLWRIQFKLPENQRAHAGTLLAGCLAAQAVVDNPAVPANMRAERHAVYDECFALLNAALDTPARCQPIAQPLPATPLPQPSAPDSLSSAPLSETPLRDRTTTTCSTTCHGCTIHHPRRPLCQTAK